MDTMERDVAFIAEQVRLVLKIHGLTQENLADMAGLTTRTIEKVVSGRHRPEEQTLRSIARAVKLEVAFFDKPSPEAEEKQRAVMERALRKSVLVPLQHITTASEFICEFDNHRHAYSVDVSAVSDADALTIAGALGDWIEDLINIWGECHLSQRIEFAREFVDLCGPLEHHGFGCFMGSYRQRLPRPGSPLLFRVGVMTVLPIKASTEARIGLVELEGDWERVE